MNSRGKGNKNRLGNEVSPYLLQHADNPVNWYPWGDEAFRKAAREDKPVFLSIGYSTCHWCHVMEGESFRDREVARLLNENLVCIKVDREERPDLDARYMRFCNLMTGSGGWPLTIIMTPEKKPFFAGTYLSKNKRFGRPGLMELIPRIMEMWNNERERLVETGEKLENALFELDEEKGKAGPNKSAAELIDELFESFLGSFDDEYGGFGGPPKFPGAHNLMFLLRYWDKTGKRAAAAMVGKSLDRMALGGIFDQLGGGFHRYSTDIDWLVPHFEKMLYDQAMMAMIYTEGYRALGKRDYKRVAEATLNFVLSEMTGSKGGFFSAIDADSGSGEGDYYLWTAREVGDLLGKNDYRLAKRFFNLRRGGNYFDPATGETTGKNIPHLTMPLEELARELDMDAESLEERIGEIKTRLLKTRNKRAKPAVDDKILCDWNGLMVAALANAARALDNQGYKAAATRGADFVVNKMRRNGKLFHRYRQGDLDIPAFLDDHSFLIWGLLELYQCDLEERYLNEARRLCDVMIEDFWDRERGGFFLSREEERAGRLKVYADSAYPSGNSAALFDLVVLGNLTGKTEYLDLADEAMKALLPTRAGLRGRAMAAVGIYNAFSPPATISIADRGAGLKERMIKAISGRYLPFVWAVDQAHRGGQEGKTEKNEIYICRGDRCEYSTSDVDKLMSILQRDKKRMRRVDK